MKDPDPDPYLYLVLMDQDPDPGGPPDPQYWIFELRKQQHTVPGTGRIFVRSFLHGSYSKPTCNMLADFFINDWGMEGMALPQQLEVIIKYPPPPHTHTFLYYNGRTRKQDPLL
jgi:hypothetical protein